MTEHPLSADQIATEKRRYVRLRLLGAGQSCVVEPHEATEMMKDDPELTATDAWMTVAEFEALPDFGGW